MPVILGIDPGVTGAMVWLAVGSKDHPQKIVACMDHSAWCAQDNPPYQARELRILLKTLWLPDIVVIEGQHARATRGPDGKIQQGISSTWNFAEHYGILLGCLTAYDRPIYTPDPAVWKASMHLSRDKGKSLALARELFPHSLEMFKRQKDHGRAEAAILAHYGSRFLPPVRREL